MFKAHSMEELYEWLRTVVQMGRDRSKLQQKEEGWIFSSKLDPQFQGEPFQFEDNLWEVICRVCLFYFRHDRGLLLAVGELIQPTIVFNKQEQPREAFGRQAWQFWVRGRREGAWGEVIWLRLLMERVKVWQRRAEMCARWKTAGF